VRQQKRAEVALFATTLIWGGTFVAAKFGLRDLSPLLLIAIRFLIAGAVIALVFRRRLVSVPRAAAVKGIILGSFLFAGFAAQTIGLAYTTASKSAFITGMMVVGVPLLQIIIERRAPKIGNIIGVIIVSLGLWLLTSPRGAEFNVGDAFTIVCAVMFAIYIVYLDVVSREMTTLQLTFIQIATTAALAWIGVWLFEPVRITLSTPAILSLLYLTVLATLVTTFVQTRFQKETTPTRAVIIFTIEPVFAATSAYLLLGEHLGVSGMFGGALIIGGVLLSELSDDIPMLDRPVVDLGTPRQTNGHG